MLGYANMYLVDSFKYFVSIVRVDLASTLKLDEACPYERRYLSTKLHSITVTGIANITAFYIRINKE
jgi:hypothetical protein